jgi:hypothetical protein
MSAPFLDVKDALLGVLNEVVSAMSSLNMYPDPIQGAEGYTSQVDANAKHAMEHLRAAFDLASRASQERDQLRTKIYCLEKRLAEEKSLHPSCG